MATAVHQLNERVEVVGAAILVDLDILISLGKGDLDVGEHVVASIRLGHELSEDLEGLSRVNFEGVTTTKGVHVDI